MRLRLPVILVGLLIAGAAFASINPKILGLFHDDGVYAVTAKALAEGDGYRIVSLPSDPAQTKYPFFYSAVLSLIWRISPPFPANIVFLKSLNILVLLGIFFVSAVYYRRSNERAGALAPIAFAVIVCTNPLVFSFTDYLLSELLLVLLSVASLAGYRSAGAGSASAHAARLGIIAGVACLTRLAAVPLVVAGLLHSYISRGVRAFAWFGGVVSLMVVPWFVWVARVGGQGSPGSLFDYYIGYDFSGGGVEGWRGLLEVISGNAHYLADTFQMLYLTPLLPGSLLFLVALTFVGMLNSLRREDVGDWGFLLSSLALYLIWPFSPTRYSVPLTPVLILFLFRGMARLADWFQHRQLPSSVLAKLVWIPGLVVISLNSFWLSSFVWSRHPDSTRGLYGSRAPYTWVGFEQTFAWIRDNTQPGELLATAYDPMYFLYTGRKAIRPALHRPATYFYPYSAARPDVGSVAEIKPQLVELGAKYLIIDPLDGYAERQATLQLMDDIVKAYGAQAQLVFTSSDGLHKVFRLTAR